MPGDDALKRAPLLAAELASLLPQCQALLDTRLREAQSAAGGLADREAALKAREEALQGAERRLSDREAAVKAREDQVGAREAQASAAAVPNDSKTAANGEVAKLREELKRTQEELQRAQRMPPAPQSLAEPRLSDNLQKQILARATATAMLKHRAMKAQEAKLASPPAAPVS